MLDVKKDLQLHKNMSRGRRLFHQFKNNLKNSFKSQLNFGVFIVTVTMAVAAYSIEFSWDIHEQRVIGALDISFFFVNLLLFGSLFNKRTVGTYLIFGMVFRFIYLTLVLLLHDIDVLISGPSGNSINKIKEIFAMVNMLILGGYAVSNIFIFPILLILLIISVFDIYVAVKLKHRFTRVTWFILMVWIQIFVAMLLVQYIKYIEDKILFGMYTKMIAGFGWKDTQLNLANTVYEVLYQTLAFIWLPLLIKINKFRKTNVFPNMDSVLSVALIWPLLGTFFHLIVNHMHNLASVPIFFFTVLWVMLALQVVVFFKTLWKNIKESKYEYYMPWVFSDKDHRNKAYKIISDFWKHDEEVEEANKKESHETTALKRKFVSNKRIIKQKKK